MKSKSNPFLRTLALTSSIVLTLGSSARADLFDTNDTALGFGVTDGSTYYWWTPNSWSDTASVDDGTAAVATWQGLATNNQQAYFAGSGTAGENYTVRLGTVDGSTDTYIQNIAINVKADGAGALAGAAGNVTIGNSGDSGKLIISASNSVGAQNGDTLTINNGVNLNAKTLNFRGGNVVINGVVSGTGASKIDFGGSFGLTSGTLTLANTANTYAGRANSDYIDADYTLEVTKLADGGLNSSIGTSSANIGINGGTLKYIGDTGSQSTNLGLHVASGGAIVDASGDTSADTISISGAPTYSATNSARTITLTGTNLGGNTMGFAFNDNGTGPNILTKTGVGRWVVNQANGYTGGTNANGGTLVAANTAAFGVAGRTINFNTGSVEFATDTTANAYVLNLGSGNTGTVVVNRATSDSTMTHTMGTATLGNGTLNITKGANVTGDATLEFGGITMSAGAPGLSTGTLLNPTTAKVLVSGNITRTGSLANLLTLDGTNTGNLISGIISGPQALTKSNVSTWELSNANTFNGITLVSGGTLKLTNNLAIQNSAFDTSGAGTLDVTTINTPTFGGLTSATDYALPVNVTSLTLNPGSNFTQTYTGNLSGGAAGLTLTKTGAGTQVLGGTNTYSGLTTVNGGELRITDATAIGGTNIEVLSGRLALDGDITVSGKSLTTSGNGTNFFGGLQSVSGTNEWAGGVLLGADNSRLGARKDATLVISGVIDDGANTYNFVVRNENRSTTHNGAGNATTITELSGTNTYGGNTQLIAGVTRLAGGNDRLPTGTILQFGGNGANAKFDMNGRNQEVAGLAVTSSLNDSQRDWNANELTNSSATLSTLTVNTTADQTFGLTTTSFGGSGNYTGIITGNIALVKDGSAKLTLTSANTYTGTTTINAGTLLINGNQVDATGDVIVDGGTLGGTGTTGGAVTVGALGAINPGVTTGTLTVDSADLSAGGTLTVDLNDANAQKADLLSVNNTLDVTNAKLVINVTGALAETSYTLASASTITGTISPSNVTGLPAGYQLVQDGTEIRLEQATGSPYETWGEPYGLTAGSEGGDLDNDGMTNFEEFAFGLIPNSGSSVNPITVQLNKTTGQFTYQRLAASGLTYTIWTSPDLVAWTEDTTATAGQVATPADDNESVVVTLTGAPLTATKLFVRVKAE